MPSLKKSLHIGRNKGLKISLPERLQACMGAPENSKCADCGDDNPSPFASLLQCRARKGEVLMGVFCCKRCCSYHYQLGRDIVVVKNVKEHDCKYFAVS